VAAVLVLVCRDDGQPFRRDLLSDAIQPAGPHQSGRSTPRGAGRRASVPPVLLDQVTEEPAQAGAAAIGPGDADELVESAVGQVRVKPPRDRSTAPSHSASSCSGASLAAR
jgi:hypothetical protein